MATKPSLTEILAVVNLSSTEWDDHETVIAAAVMKKFAICTQQRQRIPTTVFEPNLEGRTSVNSDAAVILASDTERKIYLPARNPNQVFSGQRHLPGTTWLYDTWATATQRLLDTELAPFNLKLGDLTRAGVLELQDLPRAPVQSNLHVVSIYGIPMGLEQDFFPVNTLPWDQLIVSHKTVTLPWLRDHGYI